eukprot:TRINITY_DN1194_c0_g1_i24.p1 TRINITY_DN1194_c0_g1~~TRINITY_DN1194_c0_g1_i24.p1  ORF type:complete len:180 (-),score=30.51 TRINITY_DN1194_c0_g1_i24:16-555(-)
MEAFGVRFAVNDPQRFEALRSLYAEIKRDKDSEQFRDPSEWVRLVPDAVKGRFSWPTAEERAHWLGIRDSVVVAIPNPPEQLGAEWDFFRVFEAVEEGDYDILECECPEPGIGELRIDPHGYPYGGVGPLIALVEGFGFTVLGVNECGVYESRERLLGGQIGRAVQQECRDRSRMPSSA